MDSIYSWFSMVATYPHMIWHLNTNGDNGTDISVRY